MRQFTNSHADSAVCAVLNHALYVHKEGRQSREHAAAVARQPQLMHAGGRTASCTKPPCASCIHLSSQYILQDKQCWRSRSCGLTWLSAIVLLTATADMEGMVCRSGRQQQSQQKHQSAWLQVDCKNCSLMTATGQMLH